MVICIHRQQWQKKTNENIIKPVNKNVAYIQRQTGGNEQAAAENNSFFNSVNALLYELKHFRVKLTIQVWRVSNKGLFIQVHFYSTFR